MPTLFIVPTPIGNLEDITLRALRVLREVRLIAAEDTRNTRNLLHHFEIDTPLTSYHEHNKLTKLDAIFDALAQGDVALVSDAGTPGISDPGYELIQAALARQIDVESLPGACAAVTALVASGLPTESFIFSGFLPKKEKALREYFETLTDEQRTVITYESPNRLVDTLRTLMETLGAERPVCVAREISKVYEEYQRGSAEAVYTYYVNHPPRGEIVLMVGGVTPSEPVMWDEPQVTNALLQLFEEGFTVRDASTEVANQSGWDRKVVYDKANQLKKR